MYSQIESNKRKTVLLIFLFIGLITLLGYVFAQVYHWGIIAIFFAFFISLSIALFSYFHGDKVALKTASAQPIKSKEENPYLWRLVENLCITAGLPMPKIYIIPDNAINAFACGRKPKVASVAVTQGAIDKLENEELEGVLAHELSHIKNYDILVMTIVIILVGLIALLADWFLRLQWFGFGDNDRNDRGGIFLIIGIILAIVTPFIARLIQLAVSRKREFLADANAALLTRYPEGLARALEKIAQENLPLKRASSATAHLYIASPLRGKLAKLFSTHPPIEERIAALRKMETYA